MFSFGVIMYEVMARYQMVCAVSNLGDESEIEQYAEKVSQGYRPPIPTVRACVHTSAVRAGGGGGGRGPGEQAHKHPGHQRGLA